MSTLVSAAARRTEPPHQSPTRTPLTRQSEGGLPASVTRLMTAAGGERPVVISAFQSSV